MRELYARTNHDAVRYIQEHYDVDTISLYCTIVFLKNGQTFELGRCTCAHGDSGAWTNYQEDLCIVVCDMCWEECANMERID